MFETLEAPPSWVDDYFESLDINAEVTSLSADAALDEILTCERIVASAQARQIRALARLTELRPDRLGGVIDEFTADEVAPLLRISRNAAHRRLELAIQLTGRLRGTLTALDCGDLDLYKARIIAELTSVLGDEQAATVEARILPRAADQTPGQLRAAVRRAVLWVDPNGAEERRQKRVRDRAVVLEPGEDGTADLTATHLDAAEATAAYQRLDDYARATKGDDERTMDQRRADAMVDLLLGRPMPSSSATATQVQVTIAASTLLGLDDQPGDLVGYGPITAEAARALAADGTWRRIVTDPLSGSVLDVGRTAYRPPAALADHVRTRDKTCRFPGCRQPAHRCDLDHGIPYPNGPTSASNLSCLCRHHHRLKHERDWSVEHGPDGTITWLSSTRRRYVTNVGDG